MDGLPRRHEGGAGEADGGAPGEGRPPSAAAKRLLRIFGDRLPPLSVAKFHVHQQEVPSRGTPAAFRCAGEERVTNLRNEGEGREGTRPGRVDEEIQAASVDLVESCHLRLCGNLSRNSRSQVSLIRPQSGVAGQWEIRPVRMTAMRSGRARHRPDRMISCQIQGNPVE